MERFDATFCQHERAGIEQIVDINRVAGYDLGVGEVGEALANIFVGAVDYYQYTSFCLASAQHGVNNSAGAFGTSLTEAEVLHYTEAAGTCLCAKGAKTSQALHLLIELDIVATWTRSEYTGSASKQWVLD